MHYTIQPGDTITDVTRRLGMDWDTLQTTNPKAVGRSARTGRSIIKAGATVQPTSVQAPSEVALCHQPAGTTNCGRCPAASSVPR